MTITNGHAAASDANGWLVPKKELVTTLQLLLQSRRLVVARTLPDAPTLVEELASFSTKAVSLAATEGIEWRERPHDDLVLAVAIAAWLGERWLEPFVEGPLFLSPMPEPVTGFEWLDSANRGGDGIRGLLNPKAVTHWWRRHCHAARHDS